MDRIKDMLVETIEDFRNEVCYDCRFENVFDELLVNNDSHKIIIKGDIKISLFLSQLNYFTLFIISATFSAIVSLVR